MPSLCFEAGGRERTGGGWGMKNCILHLLQLVSTIAHIISDPAATRNFSSIHGSFPSHRTDRNSWNYALLRTKGEEKLYAIQHDTFFLHNDTKQNAVINGVRLTFL